VVVRGRWTLVVSLLLLQSFTLGAGLYVWTTGFSLDDAASQAAPEPTPTRTPVPLITAEAVLASGSEGTAVDAQRLAARLKGPIADAALGGRVGAVVMDAATGDVLYGNRPTTGLTPASTTKVVTAVAALTTLGPDERLATRVVYGKAKNAIVLVGGGDPTLAGPQATRPGYPRPASLSMLAIYTARALKAAGVTKVTLGYDDSLFSGPRTADGWKPNYVPEGTVAPVTALMHDSGRVNPRNRQRWPDPARATAAAFANLLRRHGITVTGGPREAKAGATAQEVARVESPPVYQLVERMLTDSDNDLAEALARHVALRQGRRGTFEDAAKACLKVLRDLDAHEGVHIEDGSGLSIRNRITPKALAKLLALAASPENPHLHTVISGLPVAGFTGTLDDRYDRKESEQGAGLVRAKTGTLNGVTTLAGVTRTANGRLLTFAFMADRVPAHDPAVAAIDRLATIVSTS